MKYFVITIAVLLSFVSCNKKEKTAIETKTETPFVWEGANVYFLLTDRFNNADPSNDINFNRNLETGKLRGFKGGDIKGVTQKIKEGYFTKLGVNAIWMTPIVEQIHGGTDEGTGLSYGFHGYWTSDWTAIDPNFGTKDDVRELVEAAHNNGIRILLDAVINHTGPVTAQDPVWPEAWVRTEPQCDYQSYENTVTCTLVKNLPDIKTESNEAVELPPQLVKKWKAEGRYEQEVAELDAFFKRTGHPRAPRFYIMKWLTDYITDFGIDGYRVDTVKHTELYVWQEFKAQCDYAFAEFKKNNPEKVLDDNDFYLVGEVYNYGISAGKAFDFGDKKVNYFDNAFNGLINFEAKWNAAQMPLEEFFNKYSNVLNSDLKGYSVLNYFSSHDDGQPFDPSRVKPYETATKLLLCPGASQVYYGDESARSLIIEGTQGDATLRSFMNWEAIKTDAKTQDVLLHWQKLGQFRAKHPAIGAGVHNMITKAPYVFSRIFSKDKYQDHVVIGLELPLGTKTIDVSSVFSNGERVYDAYSNTYATVEQGVVVLNTQTKIALLESAD
ncbi:alpha-amylase family glycosyl hydrolase [Jejuia pallidilutea]|uniref:Periplasmic alpha-amylase n=1 Tax=Jejuia pallidilutea TaxID=504487 RepID=A0A090VQD5_9FLAO|nr:alpha-amylase family glycosyl hydrolase [Jejuia pallidilutea]GAL66945.1 periplasmic alpha-amylase [Jejuia pallidilutea]GAL70267.1 periplasmic alpha-amylase [Jejuia pallidilutea]GAL90367.1 periplasmic alpha-amylase [Jejuia pallidilutea]